MKTFSFVFLLFLVPIMLKAQRVQVGITARPSLNYRILRGGSASFVELFNAAERVKFGYSVGADVVFRPRAKWQLGAGLLYSRQGFRYQVQVTDENGGPAGELKINEHFDYLDLPVFLKFQPGTGKKQSFYYLFGVNNSLFIGHKGVLKNNPFPHPYQSELPAERRYQVGPVIGMGLHQQLNEKITLDIGPQASMQLLSLFTGNSFVNRHLYSIGLNLRLAYTY
jgi:hypothetical protein